MKKFLIPSLVIVLALLIAVPAFALEVKWGGLFRARYINQVNFTGDGGGGYGYPATDLSMTRFTTNAAGNITGVNTAAERSVPYEQHLNRFDQRLRIFIDFISSENLKVVTKFETQAFWGRTATHTPGTENYGSGNVGADSGSLNVKNAYVDFNLPGTPINAKIGVQGIALVDSWIIDSDFSAALVTANLKPFTVGLGYVAGQNFDSLHESENVDDLVAFVQYKEGPFSAGLVGFYQDAHNTPTSVFPAVSALYDDPLQRNVEAAPFAYFNPWTSRLPAPFSGVQAFNNNLFDLGFQLGYKLDYLSAYLNFVKNFGSVKLSPGNPTAVGGTATVADNLANQTLSNQFQTTANYEGWMIDAGGSYFCGPWTFNLGGFYTSGDKINFAQLNALTNGQVPLSNTFPYPTSGNIKSFVYPLSTSKYFSEIMGGGILDNIAPNGGYWRGYPDPFNIWTVTAGGAWQVLPQTKLSLSWWYFSTSNKVPARYNNVLGTWSTSSNLGNEIDFYITQNIVDKLNLDIVAAYMLTGEAFRAQTSGFNYPGASNAYELGARFQWAW